MLGLSIFASTWKPSNLHRFVSSEKISGHWKPPTSAKHEGNAQLNRWSRARSIRSGRRLERANEIVKDANPNSIYSSSTINRSEVNRRSGNQTEIEDEGDEGSTSKYDDDGADDEDGGKAIYMVSDGTGWTAEHSVNAALGQFEHCLVERACAVNTHLFSGIEDTGRLMEIVKQAATEGALLLYTLADPSMASFAKQACQLWGVPSTDVLGPTTEAIAAHIGVAPSGIPRGAPGRNPLTEEYFKRIEAIDFTIKQDDGAQPRNLNCADIVFVGVSRTGKTPLSIYMAQKGYKVANVPIVMGIDLPKMLFEVNQDKIFGLTISPVVLQTIRKARAKSLGFSTDMAANYSDMDYVKKEVEFSNLIFALNPVWPVIEVTDKAIEETAALVVRMYHDKKMKCSMPRISKRY